MSTLVVQRQVTRCTHCGLNQFMTASALCRCCHKSLVPEVAEPEPSPIPAPLALESVPKLDIASTVRELRKQRDLSQNGLAERMGISRTYISKLEGGKLTPGMYSIERIAKALNVNISTLLGEPKAWLMSDPFIAEIAVLATRLDSEHRSALLEVIRKFSEAR